MADGKQICLWISACEDPEYQCHSTEAAHLKMKLLDLNENNQKRKIGIWVETVTVSLGWNFLVLRFDMIAGFFWYYWEVLSINPSKYKLASLLEYCFSRIHISIYQSPP